MHIVCEVCVFGVNMHVCMVLYVCLVLCGLYIVFYDMHICAMNVLWMCGSVCVCTHAVALVQRTGHPLGLKRKSISKAREANGTQHHVQSSQLRPSMI